MCDTCFRQWVDNLHMQPATWSSPPRARDLTVCEAVAERLRPKFHKTHASSGFLKQPSKHQAWFLVGMSVLGVALVSAGIADMWCSSAAANDPATAANATATAANSTAHCAGSASSTIFCSYTFGPSSLVAGGAVVTLAVAFSTLAVLAAKGKPEKHAQRRAGAVLIGCRCAYTAAIGCCSLARFPVAPLVVGASLDAMLWLPQAVLVVFGVETFALPPAVLAVALPVLATSLQGLMLSDYWSAGRQPCGYCGSLRLAARVSASACGRRLSLANSVAPTTRHGARG